MTIVRVQRKEKDFFVAKKEALNCKELSFKAKGLWAYAMSRPDNWQFVVEHLINVSKEKKTAIYSALKELIKEGYCLREQSKTDKGRFESADYIIFETLEDAEEFKKTLPNSGFLNTENPNAENQPLLSIDKKPSNENTLNREVVLTLRQKGINPRTLGTNPRANPSNDTKQYGSHVILSDIQYKTLNAEYGDEIVKGLIEEINDYLASTGRKPYKDYAATIRNWWRRRTPSKAPQAVSRANKEGSEQFSEGSNRNWWGKWIKLAHAYIKEGLIYDGPDYVSFSKTGSNAVKIYYRDQKFQEICENELRKIGLIA